MNIKITKILTTLFLFMVSAHFVFAQTIAGGDTYSVAICSDSTVRSWGNNSVGNLGDGTTTQRLNPVSVLNLTGIIDVSACQNDHTLALKSDGTLWAWGYNGFGELGDSTLVDRYFPGLVLGINSVTAIHASRNAHSLAIRTDSTLWSWGRNNYGQLGDGTIISSIYPHQVAGLSGIVAVSAGQWCTVALKSDGTVWAWGRNDYGQLGNGTLNDSYVPVQVSSITGIIAVYCGNNFTIALKNDNTVWGWGSNSFGQLGDGTTNDASVPVQAIGLNGVTAIAAGADYSLSLKTDSTLWACGRNAYGEYANGTTVQSLSPVSTGVSGVIKIAAGDSHTLFVKSDSTLWTVGYNSNGQLGDGTTTDNIIPAQVQGLCQILTGIGEKENHNPIVVNIYPNPSSNKLYLQSDEKIINLKCMNYLGQVANVKLENNSINISSLPNGLYFLNLISHSGKSTTHKFIKE